MSSNSSLIPRQPPGYIFRGQNGGKEAVAYLRAMGHPPDFYEKNGLQFEGENAVYITDMALYSEEWNRKNRFKFSVLEWLGIGGVIAAVFVAVKKFK